MGGRIVDQLAAAIPELLIASPPAKGSWSEFLRRERRFDPEDLVHCLTTASSALKFSASALPEQQLSRRDFSPAHLHDLDEKGRLRRLIQVEQESLVTGSRKERAEHHLATLVVRSDRRILEIVDLPAPRRRGGVRICSLSDGSRICPPSTGARSRWRLASIGHYLGKRSKLQSDGNSLAKRVEEALVAVSGCSLPAATQCTSFILASYVYQLFEVLPLIVVEGGSQHSRACFAREVAFLACGGLLVSRRRGSELARLADERGGALVFDEPGPLVGPGGPTELGRFLLSSMRPGCASDYTCDPLVGLRPLRTFGPRLVVRARPSPVQLAEDDIVMRLAEAGSRPADRERADLTALRDDLYCWSMEFVAAQAGVKRGVIDDPYAWIAGQVGLERADTPVSSAPAAAGTIDEILLAALEECRAATGRAISSAQLSFAAYLRGLKPGDYSPERLGRWLAATGQLVEDDAVTRRRLHGQIVRIYRLKQSGNNEPEAGDPFAFCTGVPCDQCRYAEPCRIIMPGLRQTKAMQGRGRSPCGLQAN